MKVMYDKEIDPEAIKGKRIAIIGYGSQGHAHALNLRDSGLDVVVGGRPGPSWDRAREAGFEVVSVADAVKQSDIVMILLPDELQAAVYENEIAANLRPGQSIAFAHGFCIHYRKIAPADGINVFMVAPKGPGHLLRRQFEAGSGLACLLAVDQDPSGDSAAVGLAYAQAIGGGRIGIIETTFREETETDLFGEQAVLCGGLTELIRAGFDTLTEAGYAPEMAYFECLHETKLIIDLMYEGGITKMREAISNTAEYGDLTRGRRIIGEPARRAMREILDEIRSGKFAEEWIGECERGKPTVTRLAAEQSKHPIEKIGAELRSMMK